MNINPYASPKSRVDDLAGSPPSYRFHRWTIYFYLAAVAVLLVKVGVTHFREATSSAEVVGSAIGLAFCALIYYYPIRQFLNAIAPTAKRGGLKAIVWNVVAAGLIAIPCVLAAINENSIFAGFFVFVIFAFPNILAAVTLFRASGHSTSQDPEELREPVQ